MKIIVLIILAALLSTDPVFAGISLEEQRRQREISEQRRHEVKLAKIYAAAAVEAAKYQARRNRWDHYRRTRSHYQARR